MSNINTINASFRTYNFSNSISVSGYALPFSQFKFILDLDADFNINISRTQLTWNFGDGTISRSITGVHAYSKPGNYYVSVALYDKAGISYISTFQQAVTIYDFIQSSLNVYVSGSNTYELIASRITSPIKVTSTIPYHLLLGEQDNKLIIPTSSIDKLNNFFYLNYDKTPYGHLKQYSSFYTLDESSLGKLEFVEIDSFVTTSTPIFCKLHNNDIITTDAEDSNAFFCGISGHKDIYFKSDEPYSNVDLFFEYSPEEGINTPRIGIHTTIKQNDSLSYLSIDANGLSNEGPTSNLYNITKNKFGNTKIGFVIKIKDVLNFTNKSSTNSLIVDDLVDVNGNLILIPPREADVNIAVLGGYSAELGKRAVSIKLAKDALSISNVEFTIYNSGEVQHGIVQGYFIVSTTKPLTDVYISADITLADRVISGRSNTFNIYTSDFYSISKNEELIDTHQQFVDVSIQPVLRNTPVLLDNFIGSIVGNISSNIGNTIGKRVYEKISNFTNNNAAIDYCSVQSVDSGLKSVGNKLTKYNKDNYLFPCDMGRLIDIMSINFNRLRGTLTAPKLDFNTNGYNNSEVYGENLGSIINIDYIITAGKDIVAFEKTSQTFSLLNTYLPLCASRITMVSPSAKTYRLRNYNSTWGWGLLLSNDTKMSISQQLNTVYIFYEYKSSSSSVVVGSIIDSNISANTSISNISYKEWSEPAGIMTNILANHIYKKLNLFIKPSTTTVTNPNVGIEIIEIIEPRVVWSDLTTGKAGGALNMNIFSAKDHDAGIYVRNANMWLHQYRQQISGAVVYKGGMSTERPEDYGGVLITPRHVLYCNHAHPHAANTWGPNLNDSRPTTIRFVLGDNTVVNSIQLHQVQVRGVGFNVTYDLCVAVLDRDVQAEGVQVVPMYNNIHEQGRNIPWLTGTNPGYRYKFAISQGSLGVQDGGGSRPLARLPLTIPAETASQYQENMCHIFSMYRFDDTVLGDGPKALPTDYYYAGTYTLTFGGVSTPLIAAPSQFVYNPYKGDSGTPGFMLYRDTVYLNRIVGGHGEFDTAALEAINIAIIEADDLAISLNRLPVRTGHTVSFSTLDNS